MKRAHLIIFIFLAGCFGETHCPSFPIEKLNWMPYQLDSTIQFSDGYDTIKYTIVDTFRSESRSYKNNCDCDCGATAYFKTDINSENELKIEGTCNFINNNFIGYVYNFQKYGYIGEYYMILKSDDFNLLKENGTFKNEIISSFRINSKTYQNVVKLELDTINDGSLNWSKPDIWKVYIADSIGIIQFEDLNSRKIWKIIE